MQKIFEIPLSELSAGISFHLKRTLILYHGEEGQLRAIKNVCRHQGGHFLQDRDRGPCMLRCPNHGWSLDLAKMEYTNPSGGLKHNELPVQLSLEGMVSVLEPAPAKHWEVDPRSPEILGPKELQLKFYSHACMEILAGSQRIMTDPWLEGPACTIGWWLVHQPPAGWLDALQASSAIYISHNHSDHLHPHTLELLLDHKRDNLILVPNFSSRSVEIPLLTMGFTNVVALEFGKWLDLDSQTRLMILCDATGRDDSGLLLEYKGYRILNTVDCSNLNGGMLPDNLTALMAPFASSSSGFPVCWEELYSRDKIQGIIDRNLRLSMKHFLDTVADTRPKIAVPFAGFFREAHPNDRRIEEINMKNSPEQAKALLQLQHPEVLCWCASAGDILDCATGEVQLSDEPRKSRALASYNFDKYVREVERDAQFLPLQSLDGIRHYFQWVGYHANQVLHIIETDSSFKETVREFFFDFQIQELIPARPQREHQYSRMRVRAAAFRHVLKLGLPWEDISSGFQARFYREPDVYEFGFWDHFQNKLPAQLPWNDAHHRFGPMKS